MKFKLTFTNNATSRVAVKFAPAELHLHRKSLRYIDNDDGDAVHVVLATFDGEVWETADGLVWTDVDIELAEVRQ